MKIKPVVLKLQGWTLFCLTLLTLLTQAASADMPFMHLKGQTVSPAYEGWWPNEQGGYTLFFGYMNSNWEEHLNVDIGPDNYFSRVAAGELDDLDIEAYESDLADQGQPTHFYPRRNPFLFTIDVPGDFDEQELVWTLTTKGQTKRAYGSLKPDYRIDPQVISTEVGGDFGSLADSLRDNIAPELSLPDEGRRSVRVGEPLELVAEAHDPDNLPERRDGRLPSSLDELYDPPSSIVAISGPGLRFSWTVYRGRAENVSFDPVQFKTYTDTRAYANSPWSPPWAIPEVPEDNRWTARATFHEPGEYVLRGIASDGSLFSYENLTVTVRE